MEDQALTIYTIGHSTRPVEEFIAMLLAHGVRRVVDVRTVPRSRRNPQFNRESLPASLQEHGIAYTHLAELGGLRKPTAGSPNSGWRNDSFRGYADYMQTPEFAAGLETLLELAREGGPAGKGGPAGEGGPAAVMCAEAVPWRCHRSLIGDALTVRGVRVLDIMSETMAGLHKMTPFAKVDGLKITYPPEEPDSQQPALFNG